MFNAAIILAILSFLVHTILGTYETQGPLFASNTPTDIKVIFYVCWHIVTVTLLAFCILLIKLRKTVSNPTKRFLLKMQGLCWLSFGLLFPTVAFFYGGPSLTLHFPQVLLLAPVGILCLLIAKRA